MRGKIQIIARGKACVTAVLAFCRRFSPLNFAFLLLAGTINAIGVTFFIAPVQLYDSGVSGTSILLSQVTPLSLSLFLLILNVPLLLYGLKKQGVVFTVYAIYAVSVYAVVAWLITDVLPIDVSIVSPLAGTEFELTYAEGGYVDDANGHLSSNHLRHRQRRGHPLRGRDGWDRGHCGHLREENRDIRGRLCYDL